MRRVFRSKEWTEHVKNLGIEHRFTLVANPVCNGKIEPNNEINFKNLLTADTLAIFLAQVVLAVNTHYDHDLQFTPALRVYGFMLLTPGVPNWVDTQTARFDLKKRIIPLRKEYLSPKWETATHAYIRMLQRKHKLSPLYKGPFKIIDRNPRSMLLDIDGTLKRISYLHLYPIHFNPDEEGNLQAQVR